MAQFLSHPDLPVKFKRDYLWRDRDEQWDSILLVGSRGSGKGVYAQFLIRDLIENHGVRRIVGVTPLVPEAMDYVFIDSTTGEEVRLGDVYESHNFHSDVLEKDNDRRNDQFKFLYSLRDCWFIDTEMWKLFNPETIKKKPNVMNAYRHFFSLARHNGVSILCAGQDEMQVPYEQRKGFATICYVSKLPPVYFLNRFPLHPMRFEIITLPGETAFDRSNRINLEAEPKVPPFLITPTKQDVSMFDTHSERLPVENSLDDSKAGDTVSMSNTPQKFFDFTVPAFSKRETVSIPVQKKSSLPVAK